jgi:hypothetical protein
MGLHLGLHHENPTSMKNKKLRKNENRKINGTGNAL